MEHTSRISRCIGTTSLLNPHSETPPLFQIRSISLLSHYSYSRHPLLSHLLHFCLPLNSMEIFIFSFCCNNTKYMFDFFFRIHLQFLFRKKTIFSKIGRYLSIQSFLSSPSPSWNLFPRVSTSGERILKILKDEKSDQSETIRSKCFEFQVGLCNKVWSY